MNVEDTQENCYIGVYVLDVAYHFDKIYDYYINEELQGKIKRGNFITVPFGGGNKRRIAVVWEIKSLTEAEKTKPADKIIEVPALSEEQLELALYLKENTFCTIGEALKVVSPMGLKTGLSTSYSLNTEKYLSDDLNDLRDKTSERMRVVLNQLVGGDMTLEKMKEEFGDNIRGVLNTLVRQGYITEETTPERIVKEKFVKYVSLNEEKYDEYLELNAKSLTPLQYKIIDYLTANGDSQMGEILDELSVSASSVAGLEKKEIVEIYEKEVFRDSSDEFEFDEYNKDGDNNVEKFELSENQKKAFGDLFNLYKDKRPCAALLHGVTGSGKTHVVKALIDEVIADNKQVIMLVPEIALTPQTIIFFKNYYKDKVKILHSALSAGEKFDTWRRIKSGEINIVIGTRSAVFAPFQNLGLVIIDEEQEHTYKSEKKPYYHARDIARFRCAKNNAMMLLASATPSVESYYKADAGVYHLVNLNERYNDAELPAIITVDMRLDPPENKIIYLSDVLQNEIARNLKNNEQTILFQNRRGYYNFISCRSCGEVVMCPNCSISLKLHAEEKYGRYKRDKSENNSRRTPSKLVCHYCGYTSDIPKVCPKCQSEHMRSFGSGTQKCEDDVGAIFPDAKIMRMDSDTTTSKHSHMRILNSVRNGEADILIGTQMVTKGHNFKNVTLVGILFADQGLLLDDYRSNERTFEMIVQVAGRAGRYEKNGRAVIQTYNPDSDVIKYAISQDYKEFYKKEIKLRKASVFPPFCDICVINIVSEFENEAVATSKKIGEMLKGYMAGEYKDVKAVIFGPFPAPIYKLNRTYRMRYIIKCKTNKRTKEMLALILTEIQKQATKKVSVSIDVNPNMI
ncbi:MAG: primosomal protein N' [Oscillospiraceae bacterium]|nr:primosomal protein N' [Oscillospiraceae bacterium]